jgi:uncharacterized protein YegL
LNKVKRLPCQYCAARGGKKHAVGCRRPQKVTNMPIAKQPAPPQHPTARPNEVLRNRIALVIDASSSMQGFRYDVPRVVNEQVAEIKKNAAKLGQPTSLTIYSFADSVHELGHYEDVFTFRAFDGYVPSGNTAMFDGIGSAITDFQRSAFNTDPNTSFLIVVVTDGEENRSRNFSKASLTTLMRDVERTDRWTFAFSVPRGGRATLRTFGIPDGNIQEWEQTGAGLESMSRATVSGLGSYYGARSAGLKRVSNFFEPDMTQVSRRAIQRLDDLSRNFHAWNVDAASPIREFVEGKLAQQPSLARQVGSSYQIGRGYYQLTKAEEVQAGKDFVILDKNTNALYGGDQARQLIGCPMNTSFKIKPGNLANYEIYIKSTSVNRKLVPNTKVLYFVG